MNNSIHMKTDDVGAIMTRLDDAIYYEYRLINKLFAIGIMWSFHIHLKRHYHNTQTIL